jgi:hypothetical protein
MLTLEEVCAEELPVETGRGAKQGEAFRVVDGLPVPMARAENDKPWFAFAQTYVDMKWRRAAAKSRAGNADALATATLALLASRRGKPDDAGLRKAMTGWAFNCVGALLTESRVFQPSGSRCPSAHDGEVGVLSGPRRAASAGVARHAHRVRRRGTTPDLLPPYRQRLVVDHRGGKGFARRVATW